MSHVVLGLNAFHGDAAACLVVDGELVAAAEEERFRRIKHWAGFPALAARWCLDEAGLDLTRVGHVAINSDPRANLFAKLAHLARGGTPLTLVRERLRNASRRASFAETLAEVDRGSFSGQVHRVEHHEAHLASAWFASGFDDALAVSVDGFGDFASTAWGRWTTTRRAVAGRVRFPHSLGVFYQAMTQYLGFPEYGDEYKVMGLAAWGEGARDPRVDALVPHVDGRGFRLDLECFRHHRESVPYRWEGGRPTVGALFSEQLPVRLGAPARAPDEPVDDRVRALASATQATYERVLFTLLSALRQQHGGRQLVLAGGCAMNSLANGRLTDEVPFDDVYVQAAAGDAGGALGAAAVVSERLGAATSGLVMQHASLGPGYSNEAVESALADAADALADAGCRVVRHGDEAALCESVAGAIADGEVVGWFHGRMEWGPRALGNRSILADPRRRDMRSLLNERIKLREPFRPFAPSVLAEAAADWFEGKGEVPFMSRVWPVRAERRETVPAITHVDGTGRLQTVTKVANPRYHRLIETFDDLTGVPMLLNTSFNENEPIVATPVEAIDCFLRTRMDRLAIEDFEVVRDNARTQAI